MATLLPASHFIGWSDVQNERSAEMLAHGILIERDEFLARKWEEGEQRLAQMSADEREKHQWLLVAYIEDVGVHPQDRKKLDQLIDAELINECRRDLVAVISEVNDQTNHSVHPPVDWVNPYQS